MKKILVLLSLIAALTSNAETVLRSSTLPAGTTNVLGPIDCSQSTSFATAVSFAGVNSMTTQISITNTAGGTNGQTLVIPLVGVSTNTYTWTNSVTLPNQVLVATNTASAATNLYNQLLTDYAGVLFVTISASNVVTLSPVFSTTFTNTSAVGGWATVVTNTAAIAGTLSFKGSNSLDGVLWFRDASRDFSMSYNSTSAVTASNSFTGLPPFNYWEYAVENAATNCANAASFQFKANAKKGL